jgi:hypothetical protein
MKWYKTKSWGTDIIEVEVLSETDKSLMIIGYLGKPERVMKRTAYDNYHRTKNDAIDFKIDIADQLVKQKETQLQYAKEEYEKIYNELMKQRV